jgi:DNA-directed RNA polymerase subunit RPC12/RpoP
MKLPSNLDKIGITGLFLAALATPCCFPLFAFLLSAFGFGSAELFGGWTKWVFEALVLMSLIGLFISYRKHRCIYPLLVATPSAIIIYYGYNCTDSNSWNKFIYVGMFGLLVATIWNYQRNKLQGSCGTCKIIDGKKIELESTITCQNCGHKKKEVMPVSSFMNVKTAKRF